jgi:hypothetical protein
VNGSGLAALHHDGGMTLQLAREEPEAGPWRAELLAAVVEALIWRGPGRVVSGRPVILAVDGRSNAGKTTLQARLYLCSLWFGRQLVVDTLSAHRSWAES